MYVSLFVAFLTGHHWTWVVTPVPRSLLHRSPVGGWVVPRLSSAGYRWAWSLLSRLHRHQTILHTFSQLFLNSTLSGVPHLYRQLPNGQYLSDLCKMCNLEANLRKMWTGDHRILTYIFKWERLNTAGHSHTVSIGHWVAPLYND